MGDCQGAKKIHFIGIGGIGVSALARYFLWRGAKVSGSDLASSEITDGLKGLGVKITIGQHKKENVPPDADLIIYSPAVQPDNLELLATKSQITNSKSQINSKFKIRNSKLQILSYPQVLGELTRQYFTVAVSGSHGKSTTTAMLANILIKAGLDPAVIIGTKLKEFGNSNFRAGKSNYLIIEADEWNASFLNYWPKMIVLTNIDREHLDYYKNLKNILRTFQNYISHLPDDGFLIANGDDENIRKMLNPKSLASRDLAKPDKIRNPKQIRNSKFKTFYYGKKILNSEFLILNSLLKVPGEHNVYNALAALAAARALKIPDKTSFKALAGYRGAWRRFEFLGKFKGADVISDYAHHPTEIKATLAAACQKYPEKEIWCVFQPHQIQRTEFLFKDFVSAFDSADRIFLLDIYGVAGREKERSRVSSEKLALAIRKRGNDVGYFGDFGAAVKVLKKGADRNKVILVMGAGDIWKIGKHLTNKN